MTTELPEDTVAAFGTLCGATVAMTKLAAPRNPRLSHAWTCLGCGAIDEPDTEPRTRQAANSHAGECRSTPLPA